MPIEYHQNNVTEAGDFILSHSHLCKIDPRMGGHPKIFYKAITEPQVEDKPSFNNGNILHHYLEHKDSYIISELTKPGEQASNWAESFYNLYCKDQWKSDSIFLNTSAHDTQVDKKVVPIYSELFRKINNRSFENEEEFALFISSIRYSRDLVSYNKTIKVEETLLNHFNNIIEYINFLQKATGKIILTNTERDTLINCKAALEDHPIASQFLSIQGEVEKEMFWKLQFADFTINRKAKIDKVIVDHNKKKGWILDWKTSNPPVSNFTSPDGNYWKYRSGRQLTSYELGLCVIEPQYESYQFDLLNIVIQTNNNYPVIVYKTPNSLKYNFKSELSELYTRYIKCVVNNKWNITSEESDFNCIEIKAL